MKTRRRDPAASERHRLAETIADRMDGPVTAAGVVFLLLVVAETVSSPTGVTGAVFSILGWVLWAVFVGEFVLRLVVAPSTKDFLRRNWWQIVFLVVPFLRFLRVLRVLRAARVGRVVSSAVRSSRSAGRQLSSRLATAGVVTLIIILAGSQLLFESGAFESYDDAVHAAALATMVGQPSGVDHGFVRLVELVLLAYSVIVFAALAGTFGAYLLDRKKADEAGA